MTGSSSPERLCAHHVLHLRSVCCCHVSLTCTRLDGKPRSGTAASACGTKPGFIYTYLTESSSQWTWLDPVGQFLLPHAIASFGIPILTGFVLVGIMHLLSRKAKSSSVPSEVAELLPSVEGPTVATVAAMMGLRYVLWLTSNEWDCATLC
jgi:hypothetical protein